MNFAEEFRKQTFKELGKVRTVEAFEKIVNEKVKEIHILCADFFSYTLAFGEIMEKGENIEDERLTELKKDTNRVVLKYICRMVKELELGIIEEVKKD